MSNFDGTKVSKDNLILVWKKVAELIKLITGDVNIKEDGNLLYQIQNINLDGLNAQLSEQIQEVLKIISAVDGSLVRTQMNFLQLAMIVKTMTDAEVIGSDNAAIELFDTEDGIMITSGSYDGVNKRLYA